MPAWSDRYLHVRSRIEVCLVFSIIQLNDANIGGRLIGPQCDGILGILILTRPYEKVSILNRSIVSNLWRRVRAFYLDRSTRFEDFARFGCAGARRREPWCSDLWFRRNRRRKARRRFCQEKKKKTWTFDQGKEKTTHFLPVEDFSHCTLQRKDKIDECH